MKSNIPELVDNSKKTVTELAREAGISRSIMSQLANSKTVPDKTRFDALTGIAKALEVPINQLFSEDYLKVRSANKYVIYQDEEAKVDKNTPRISNNSNMKKNLPDTVACEMGLIRASMNQSELPLWFSYKASGIGAIAIEILSNTDIGYFEMVSDIVAVPISDMKKSLNTSQVFRHINADQIESIGRSLEDTKIFQALKQKYAYSGVPAGILGHGYTTGVVISFMTRFSDFFGASDPTYKNVFSQRVSANADTKIAREMILKILPQEEDDLSAWVLLSGYDPLPEKMQKFMEKYESRKD